MKRTNRNFVPGTDGWFSRPMHCCLWIAAQGFLSLWGDWSAFVRLFFWEIKTQASVFDVKVSLWGIMGWDCVHFGWWLTRSLKEGEAGTLVWWFGDSWDQPFCFWFGGMHLNCVFFPSIFLNAFVIFTKAYCIELFEWVTFFVIFSKLYVVLFIWSDIPRLKVIYNTINTIQIWSKQCRISFNYAFSTIESGTKSLPTPFNCWAYSHH